MTAQPRLVFLLYEALPPPLPNLMLPPQFATGSDDDASTNAVVLCLWETEGFKVRAVLRGHIGAVKCVHFSPRTVSGGETQSWSARASSRQNLLASGSVDR